MVQVVLTEYSIRSVTLYKRMIPRAMRLMSGRPTSGPTVHTVVSTFDSAAGVILLPCTCLWWYWHQYLTFFTVTAVFALATLIWIFLAVLAINVPAKRYEPWAQLFGNTIVISAAKFLFTNSLMPRFTQMLSQVKVGANFWSYSQFVDSAVCCSTGIYRDIISSQTKRLKHNRRCFLGSLANCWPQWYRLVII